MINNIKEFINIIKNKNFDIKLINLIYTVFIPYEFL